MASKTSDILQGASLTFLSEWASILTLIFGGCCSNALTLEQFTNRHPHSGTLLTFCQFLLITLHGLPKFVKLKPYPHLRPRQIPILPYLLQVLLFYCISLLNNAAFAYSIPMPVHIIFRSGGLVVTMVLNRILLGRKYNLIQIMSVMSVTAGVILTTLSASAPKHNHSSFSTSDPNVDSLRYSKGIGLLTLALILGGFLGIVQDRTYTRYGRQANKDAMSVPGTKQSQTTPWQESMFYLHFLSMPMFLFNRKDLVAQFRTINAGPKSEISLPFSFRGSNSSLSLLQIPDNYLPHHIPTSGDTLSIPTAYIPLALNTITQLFCVAGVNRLTSRVSSLTVTLILVIRKAVSLVISLLVFNAAGRALTTENKMQLWSGALLVFTGTMGYSLGAGRKLSPDKAKRE